MKYLYKPGTAGTYKPTFFSLSINKEDVLNEQKKIKEEYDSIFFHEYIHYLQDILTSFGLRNFAKLVRQYSIINHEIIAAQAPLFSIPYIPLDPSLRIEGELFRLIWGTPALDNDYQDYEVLNIEMETYTGNPHIKDFELISVNIIYRDTLEQDAFYLGAIHFLENMAHLLERKRYLTDEQMPFPYKVIEKIVRTIFHTGEQSARNLILIMEASLDAHNPARYFFDFYQYCLQNNYTFDEPTINKFKDIYRFEWLGQRLRHQNFFYLNAKIARDGFKAMFNHEKLNLLNDWARLIIANVIKIRRSGFSFADLLMIDLNEKLVDKRLSNLLKRLGTPVINDLKYGTFVLSPENKDLGDAMIYLLGVDAILNVLNGDATCSILPYCQKSHKDPTDNNCHNSPWARTKIEPLCIFAQLWIMWGFVRKDIGL